MIKDDKISLYRSAALTPLLIADWYLDSWSWILQASSLEECPCIFAVFAISLSVSLRVSIDRLIECGKVIRNREIE